MHVLTSPMEDMCQRAPGRSHAPDAQAAFAQHCCGDMLLTTAVFAASVCQMAFWCHLWLVCQSAAFSQMGPGKGLIPGEHYIRYYIFQIFGLRQAGQVWKCGLSVQAMLSREVALVVVYQCWREGAEPGAHHGPQLGQKPMRHSRRYRACKAKFKACGRELAGGEDCQCFLGSCHSQLSLIGGRQFRSETHHGHIWSSSPAGPLQAAPCHGLACTGQSLCGWEASQEAPALALATVGLPFFNHLVESSIAWWYRNAQAHRGP